MPAFFSYDAPEPPPGMDEHAEWEPSPWMDAPRDELPAVLATPRILARTDRVVLSLSRVEIFAVGVRIPIDAVVRRRGESHHDWFSLLDQRHGPHPPVDGLRLGVELADGTRLGTEVEPHHPFREDEPAGPVLVNQGGGGGGGGSRWDLTFKLWVWPLPPAGTLDVVAEWRVLDVPESRVTLDATLLRDAVGAVQPLWAD